MSRQETLPERLARLGAPLDGGCIRWKGTRTKNGYGSIWSHGQNLYAHRAAWEAVHGPIPRNRVVDHLCRRRDCINVAHMELVTHRVNILRGVGPTARNARKTECDRGHPLSGENLRLVPYGDRVSRRCRACDRERERAYRARHPERLRERERLRARRRSAERSAA